MKRVSAFSAERAIDVCSSSINRRDSSIIRERSLSTTRERSLLQKKPSLLRTNSNTQYQSFDTEKDGSEITFSEYNQFTSTM